MPRLAVAVLSAALALALALPALAATGPGGQRNGIVSAVTSTFTTDQGQYDVKRIKITSIPDKVWAIAQVEAKPAFVATFQSFTAILLKVPAGDAGGFRWVVADYGTAFVGCGTAPTNVVRDLTGARSPCPPAAFG